MGVPSYDKLYIPFLKCLKDKEIHTHKEITNFCSDYYKLSDEEICLCMPNGRPYIKDRVSWASTYLKKAGLIDSAGKGKYLITAEGITVLESGVAVDNSFLMKYPSFADFVGVKPAKKEDNEDSLSFPVMPNDKSPLEQIEDAVAELNKSLAEDLMTEVMKLSCWQFERFVIKLLIAMGYGSMLDNEDAVTKKVGDGGIDGILRADKFGFDSIYIFKPSNGKILL